MSVPITKPTVGASNGTWGTEANAVFDALNAADYFARKTADETVTASLTLQDDDHLTLALPIGTFLIQAAYLMSGTAASDVQVAWQFSGTTTQAVRGGNGPTINSTGVAAQAAATTVGVNRAAGAGGGSAVITSATGYGVDGTSWSYITESGVLVVTVAGTLKVQWAQVAASGSAIMRAGSYLWARQVA